MKTNGLGTIHLHIAMSIRLKPLTANYKKINTFQELIEINIEEDSIDEKSKYRNESDIIFVSIKVKLHKILSSKVQDKNMSENSLSKTTSISGLTASNLNIVPCDKR